MEQRTGTEVGTEIEAETETGTEAETEAGTEVGTEIETETRTGTEVETEIEAETETRTGTEVETEIEAETETGTEAETEAGTEDRSRDRDRSRNRDRDRSRDRDRNRDKDRDRSRDRNTDRDRDRSRDRRKSRDSSRDSSEGKKDRDRKDADPKAAPIQNPVPRAVPKKEPSGMFKDLLERHDTGDIDEHEIKLLKKMKLQRNWFMPPEELFMAQEGTKVVVRKGDTVVDTVSLDGSPYYLMGKDANVAEIACEHPTISRVHCVLYFEEGNKINLMDLSSTHGTYVNKTKLAPMEPYLLGPSSTFHLAQSGRMYHLDLPKPISEKKLRKKEDALRKKQAMEAVLASAGPKRDEAAVRAEAKEREAALAQQLQAEREAKKAAAEKVRLSEELEAERKTKAVENTAAQEKKNKEQENVLMERKRNLEKELQLAKVERETKEQEARERASREEEEKKQRETAAEDNEVSDIEDIKEKLDVLEEQRVSKKLASLLLKPDAAWGAEEGWVKAEHLLQELQSGITIQHLKEFAEYDAHHRFRIKKLCGVYYLQSSDTKQYYDNAVQTSPFTPTGPLIHGTTLKAWKAIQKQGLTPIKRTYLYFAAELPSEPGRIEGLSKAAEVYIYLDAAKAHADGIAFLSTPTAVCSAGKKGVIKAKYITKAVSVKTGDALSKK
eukprot:TRINITY_DN4944_c0_g1_i1.p1 TRINITY_DN4944_c0_g1~~TRINITY_DN4944_c0_g1_i1.p1  ORF type:complete len:669 (+),score=241.82 TRINITY_DN4944_c0_g1_i1:113-2119(+)